MTKPDKNDSGFALGMIIGLVVSAVIAIVIHKQDKDKIGRQLKLKIKDILNPKSRSKKAKPKTVKKVSSKTKPKPRLSRKPKTFIGAKRS